VIGRLSSRPSVSRAAAGRLAQASGDAAPALSLCIGCRFARTGIDTRPGDTTRRLCRVYRNTRALALSAPQRGHFNPVGWKCFSTHSALSSCPSSSSMGNSISPILP
jgi:hypothetical protein